VVSLTQQQLHTEQIFSDEFSDFGFFEGYDISNVSDLDMFFPSHDFSTIILSGKGKLPSLSSLRTKIVDNFPNISNHLAIDFSGNQKSRNIVIRVLLGSPVPAKDLFIFSASYENLFWMPLLSEILQSSFSVVTNIPLRYTDEDINELIHPLPASCNRLGNTLVRLNYSTLELQSITCCRGMSFKQCLD
jgi:hypothetical protein